MSDTPERRTSWNSDWITATIRTEKHSRYDQYGRFYLAGGDELVELPRSVVFGDYVEAKALIDTARGLADTFGS